MSDPRSFEDFIATFGLKSSPFTQFSTEDELSIRDKLFYSPPEYSPTLSAFRNGQTIFVVGNRGIGKTALLYDLEDQATKDENLLLAKMDDFSKLPNPFTSEDFYPEVIKKLTVQLFFRLTTEQHRIKPLKVEERMLLVYLLREFHPKVDRGALVARIEALSKGRARAFFKRVYNFSLDFLNYGAHVAIQLASDTVRQAFSSLPPVPDTVKLKKYFPEIPYEADKPLEKQDVTYEFLDRCLDLTQKVGFSRFVLILDKIDEDNRLKNDAQHVAQFAETILTDNKMLLNGKFQGIVSIWSLPFRLLERHVRSQKLYSAYLSWSDANLGHALNKRLGTFSSDALTDYRTLFAPEVNAEQLNEIFYLANHNPRDLWHLFDKLFHAQYELDPAATLITLEAVKNGLEDFVKTFNFYEYYPRDENAHRNSMDVYAFIRHLLRTGKLELSTNALKEATNTSQGTANNYIGLMQHMGLVEDCGKDGRSSLYRITDPKIRYAIANGIAISSGI